MTEKDNAQQRVEEVKESIIDAIDLCLSEITDSSRSTYDNMISESVSNLAYAYEALCNSYK